MSFLKSLCVSFLDEGFPFSVPSIRSLEGGLKLHPKVIFLVGDFSQFIIATHSPIIWAYPEATIYEFSESGVEVVSYRESQAYDVTSRFMRDPEGMVKRLLE